MTRRKLRVLLVVCARKGSARLKGKHHLPVAGWKVWEWVAEAGKEVLFRSPVETMNLVVSTDDKKISKCFCGHVVHREPDLASSEASIHLALQEAVGCWCPGRFDVVVCLPANVPTVTPEIILKCIGALGRNPSATAAMTVRPIRDQPEWLWIRSKNGILKRWSRSAKFRVQDFPERFHATGTCCAVRTKVLMSCRSNAAFAWLGKKVIGVLDPDAIEIHDEHDYKLAKAVLEAKL